MSWRMAALADLTWCLVQWQPYGLGYSRMTKIDMLLKSSFHQKIGSSSSQA